MLIMLWILCNIIILLHIISCNNHNMLGKQIVMLDQKLKISHLNVKNML
uniref:Uncharacterized protein n=1 Tax=Megaselia scalaris TaxID=36166 RepID=T1GUV4_MEGSC